MLVPNLPLKFIVQDDKGDFVIQQKIFEIKSNPIKIEFAINKPTVVKSYLMYDCMDTLLCEGDFHATAHVSAGDSLKISFKMEGVEEFGTTETTIYKKTRTINDEWECSQQ